jgi:hypothetical protein
MERLCNVFFSYAHYEAGIGFDQMFTRLNAIFHPGLKFQFHFRRAAAIEAVQFTLTVTPSSMRRAISISSSIFNNGTATFP